jgi:hypothetical protein
MALRISRAVRNKLANKNPPVSQEEIEQCFVTRERGFLEDTRDRHRTLPPTQWFISDTYMGRLLKVVFIALNDGSIAIRTAYDPNKEEKRIYNKYSSTLS